MKKILGIALMLIAATGLFADNAALAAQWQIVGPRAIGMGGAHVAVVNDATAQYWNPAAFGFFGRQAADRAKRDEHSDRDFGIHVHGGLGYQTHENIIEELEDVTQFDYKAISDDIDGTDGTPGFSNYSNVDEYLKMMGELEDLSRENIAVTALVDVSANIRLRNWGIGMMSTLDVSAIPRLDLYNVNPESGTDMTTEFLQIYTDTGANNTLESLTPQQFSNLSSYVSSLPNWDGANAAAMIYTLDDAIASDPDITPGQIQSYVDAASAAAAIADNAVGGGSFDSNTSVLEFRGAAISEVPLTYGHAFNDNFSIGGNIKAMKGRTYYYRALIYNSDTDNVFEDVIEDQYEESSAVGVDLGVLYKIGGLRLGIVGRNLNTPSFDSADPAGDYELEPQVRAGLAYRLWNRITVAADLDLTENDTNVSDNYKSRNMGLGVEADIWLLNLRAGTYKNLSESDIGPVYTAGLGLDFYAFQLDAGVAWSKDKVEVEGDELREEVRGELALSFQY